MKDLRARVMDRVHAEEAAAGEPLYFIQLAQTWHGDMLVFWAKGGSGYVVDIEQAGLYPASHAKGRRDIDLYWRPADLVDALTLCVNSERMRGQKPVDKSILASPRCPGCNEHHAPNAECEAPSTRMDSPEMMS